MVKSIFKRIIVGVGVALALMFIKGNLLIDVNAAATGSALLQGQSVVVSNLDTGSTFTYSGGTWANWGRGTLFGSISLMKVGGSSTAPPVTIRQVQAKSGSGLYVCDLGSLVTDNSTFENQSYTIKCPMTLGSYGFDGLNVIYADNQQNEQSQYRVRVKDLFTYVQENDFQFNSSAIITSQNETKNAINQQTQIIQQQTEKIEDNTEAVNELNDTLKSEDSPDTEGLFEDLETDESNSPVSDLITMPLTLLQAINNNSGGTCTTWNLGSLLGTNITMPCINISDIVGANLYNIIDMAICLFLAYNLGLMCITIYNNLTSLNDDFDSMYAPKHEEHGKHGRVE